MDFELKNIRARLAPGVWIHGASLRLASGQVWAIVGPNGSGKSGLGRLLSGELKDFTGEVFGPPERAASLSFESHLAAIERELREDDTDFTDRIDPGRCVRDFLLEGGKDEKRAEILSRKMGIFNLLGQGLRFLSTGEIRKALLVRALLKSPDLLVLDDPYCGLDASSREALSMEISLFSEAGTVLVLVLGRRSQMPLWVTHVVEMGGGELVYAGPKGSWQEIKRPSFSLAGLSFFKDEGLSPLKEREPLVSFSDVSVSYGEKKILKGASFEVFFGENWLITGPNGSGKSTLLSMINGDNPKAYGQNISLFGRKKGSGESIWEIKKRIGYLSAEFQIAYRASATPFSAILSGLSDSIGTYRRFSFREKEVAMGWLETLGMEGVKDRPLRSLSAGQQRMVLIARAMIKGPDLLILDEPCQGLDDAHTEMVMALAEALGSSQERALLYVTHDSKERLSCITHHLTLTPSKEGGSTASVRSF